MQNTSIRILLYINKNTICIIDLLHLICYVCMYIFMTLCTNATFCGRCTETFETLYNERWNEHPTAAHNCICSVSEVCKVVVKCAAQVSALSERWSNTSEWKPTAWDCGFQIRLLTWTQEPHSTPEADGWNGWEASVDRFYSFCSFLWYNNPQSFSVFTPSEKVRYM